MSIWTNTEFEVEPCGSWGVIFYEPLACTVPPELCHPYCCYIGTVIFYKKPWPGNLVKISEIRSKWDLLGHRFSDEIEGWAGVAPFVWHEGELLELGSGQVVWREGQWFKKWTAWWVRPDDKRWPFIKRGETPQLSQGSL